MHESMISRWNQSVKRGDIVYHLGDFAFVRGSSGRDKCDRTLDRLNGRKWLIAGNHDKKEVLRSSRWENVSNYLEIKCDLAGMGSQLIVLCHYSMRVWNKKHFGSWMLHGHSHGNLPDVGGKTLDVGVDVHNYTPVSLDEVKSFMDGRERAGFCQEEGAIGGSK